MSPKNPNVSISNQAVLEAVNLFANELVLKNATEEVRAKFAELKVFDPISDTFNKTFGKLKREKGQLFVPVRRGWPQPNVVTNPDEENPAVIQVNKVLVDGKETSFGSLLKAQFPGKDFDGYDLKNAQPGSEVSLAPTGETPALDIINNTREAALAIVRRGK
jgi:hypothetical protein